MDLELSKIKPVQGTDIYKCVQYNADQNINQDLVNLNDAS